VEKGILQVRVVGALWCNGVMADRVALEDLSEKQLLRHGQSSVRARRQAEVEVLCCARAWAARRGPESIDPVESRRPGRQVLRWYGGPGTPQVAEFAGADFGTGLGRSAAWGSRQMATVLDLDHRLPMLARRVFALEVDVSVADFVARRTRHLPLELALFVDSCVARSAGGEASWSQFEGLVEAAIKKADPEAARRREEEARREQFAKRTRANDDGMASFFIRAPFPVIARLDAMVDHLATMLGAIGVEAPVDELRVLAVAVLSNPPYATELLARYAASRHRPADPEAPTDPEAAEGPDAADDSCAPDSVTPSGVVAAALALFLAHGGQVDGENPTVDWSKLLPQVKLFVHTYAGAPGADEATNLARIEGYGAVTDAWVRDYLGPKAKFRITQVIDLAGQAPVGSYEIPDRHRQAVRLMTPADVFPFASAHVNQPGGWTSAHIDHTIAWKPAPESGEEEMLSRIGNYGPMIAFHHRVKTHGGWQVKQPFPGIFVWRHPQGLLFLVDHRGTRVLPEPEVVTTRRTTRIHLDLTEYVPAA
jgi:hypothetical protein